MVAVLAGKFMAAICLMQCCCFQAYYRQGVALQCLGRHADALGAFASALAQDDKSPQLLNSLTEAAMKSPLRGKYFSNMQFSFLVFLFVGLTIEKDVVLSSVFGNFFLSDSCCTSFDRNKLCYLYFIL